LNRNGVAIYWTISRGEKYITRTETAVIDLSLNVGESYIRNTTPAVEVFEAKNVVHNCERQINDLVVGFQRRPPDLGYCTLDASDYRNSFELPSGGGLVVGRWTVRRRQIAQILSWQGRSSYFSLNGHIGRLSRRYRGADYRHWMVEMGLF